ncbi:MAG: ribonuclease H-like domain-containing protein [Chloroflexota bacterium]
MTIALERRLANFRTAGGGALAQPALAIHARQVAIGAERLAAEVDGELIRTPAGTFVRVERRSDVIPIDRQRLASLPGQPPAHVPLVCLDTETTGLATAAGTLAFLVGLGWWEGAHFRQIQLLLPDHADEPALLNELRRHIPAAGWLVTYNGRGFDWPLLVARYRMAGSPAPDHAGHLDLLPVVRRLFRHRMPDARLQTAETHLLGLRRHDDVPGWEIPARYLQFLRDGEPASLVKIVTHNDEDVRSLARVMAYVDHELGDREARVTAPPGDLAGLARSFSSHGQLEDALDCIDIALRSTAAAPVAPPGHQPETTTHAVREEDDAWWSPRRRPDYGGRPGRISSGTTWGAVSDDRLHSAWTSQRFRLDRARLLRRLGRYTEAEGAWIELADAGGALGALAWTEIAKLREHRLGDLQAALAATMAALRLLERARHTGRATAAAERDLARRATRLRHRIARRAIRLGRHEPRSTRGRGPQDEVESTIARGPVIDRRRRSAMASSVGTP